MDRRHYYKKHLWKAITNVCALIIGLTPLAFFIFDDASVPRAIVLVISALILLVVGIWIRSDLAVKESEHKQKTGKP